MRGHVAKKGNNYYAVVYEGMDPATGKEQRPWHAAGPRRSDADRLVNDLVRRRHDGDITVADRASLGAYLTERWLPLQESRLRPRTYRSYKSVVELHIVPRIGPIRLAKLQADDLDGLYVEPLRDGNRRGKAGGGLSPASVRYVHRVLRKALGDAHRKGIVSRNVAVQADPPSPAATAEPEAMQVWDAAELRHFLEVTATHRHHVLFTVVARTGMRRGEVLALRWHDIDFDRLVAKHGMPRIRFHDLRHTHATLLLRAGVPVKVVSERLGHASPGFTLNVYQHVLPGMQAEAAEVFERLLDAAIS